MAFVEGLFCTQTLHLGSGLYIQLASLQGWPLRVTLHRIHKHTCLIFTDYCIIIIRSVDGTTASKKCRVSQKDY